MSSAAETEKLKIKNEKIKTTQTNHTPARKLPSEESRVESGLRGWLAKNLKNFDLCIAISQEHFERELRSFSYQQSS